MNTLDKKLQFKFDEKSKPIDTNHFKDMRYTGQLFGMVDNGNPISKEETLKRLTNADTVDSLIEIIRFVVGNMWLFVKDSKNAYLISALDSFPYYFYKKDDNLYFTNIESEICKLAVHNGEKISPFDLYDFFTAKKSNPSLYGALFQNIERVPNGHFLTISKNHNLTYVSYLNRKSKSNIKDNYKYFKKVLEATAKLYTDSGKKIVVIFSAGLDSYVVYLALRKFSDKVFPVTTAQEFDGSTDGGRIRERVKIVKEISDVDVDIINVDRYSKSQRKIRDEVCKSCCNNNAGWDGVWYCYMEKYGKTDEHIFISGQVFDSGYGIAYTKIYNNAKDFLMGWLKRYFFTKAYQQHMNNFLNRKIRAIFAGKSNINPKTEYLTAMSFAEQYENIGLPLIKDYKSLMKDEFFRRYKEYKEKKYLKCAFSNMEEIENLNKKEINKKIRILRHYYSTSDQLKTTCSRDYYSKQHTYHLPGDGPMMYYFCNHQLGWRDLLIPKRFLYKYFREVTGKEHFIEFNPFRLGQYSPKVQKDIQGERFTIRKAELDKFMFSQVFQDDFRSKVNLDNPSVLRYLDDSYVEKYVREYYDDAKRGLLDFNEIQKIYNLEIFLTFLPGNPLPNNKFGGSSSYGNRGGRDGS